MDNGAMGPGRGDWTNWKWQNSNRVTDFASFREFFPGYPPSELNTVENYFRHFRFAVTPYFFSLVAKDEKGNPLPGDPLWKQVFLPPSRAGEDFEYDGDNVNWENPAELVTPILHHKYPDRALLRITDHCICYCNYCYLTSRILDRNVPKHNLNEGSYWQDSLDYLRAHPEVRDVLVSGGEPLLLETRLLAKIFEGLRAVPSVKTIRLNTRALSYNPFRFDDELVKMLCEFRLTALEVHVSHPAEITPEFDRALDRLDAAGRRPMILWRAPLLRGINDSADVLEKLFLMLYERRIEPYYLFHDAPYSLSRGVQGVSIRRGASILRELRRRIPGPSFPRYTLFHVHGKQDIPLSETGTDEFRYEKDEKGNGIVRFLNWKNEWSVYPDVDETGN